MSRFLVLVFGVVVLIVVVAALVLGTFPPAPHTQQVDHVLPNDKFAPSH